MLHLIGVMLLGIGSELLFSIWVVPKYIMDPEVLQEASAHCQDIGIGLRIRGRE